MDINELFNKAISEHGYGRSGSIRITCNCGRTHYGEDGDFEEGEREELEKNRKENPDKYIIHFGETYISSCNFNGAVWVLDCECNWFHKYAAFIWYERKVIIEFLKQCKREKIEEAMEIDKLMENTGDIK